NPKKSKKRSKKDDDDIRDESGPKSRKRSANPSTKSSKMNSSNKPPKPTQSSTMHSTSNAQLDDEDISLEDFLKDDTPTRPKTSQPPKIKEKSTISHQPPRTTPTF